MNSRAGERSVAGNTGETKELGELLFTNYVLPFEIVSLLLLVAMVGCILLSRPEQAPEPIETEEETE
jgi:NADH-quinone oxidoreductase subunit J